MPCYFAGMDMYESNIVLRDYLRMSTARTTWLMLILLAKKGSVYRHGR